MTLVNTRQKLQPFVDEGVVHKDRKRCNKKKDYLPEQKKENRENLTLQVEARDFKLKIQEYMEKKQMHELDHLLNEIALKLDDTKYSN